MTINRSSIRIAVLGVVFAAVGAAATPTTAAVLIDFGVIAPTTGSISYPVLGGPVIGTGIEVDNMFVAGTIAADGVYDLVSATLDFASNGIISAQNFAGTVVYTFAGGPGSSITITGGVDLNPPPGITGGDIPTGSILMAGTFAGNVTVTSFLGGFNIAGSAFTDTKNADLLAFLGIAPGVFSGGFNLSFSTPGQLVAPLFPLPADAGAIWASSGVLSGDIVNNIPDGALIPVPEPTAALAWVLLGLTFSSGAYCRRRMQRRRSPIARAVSFG